jgi:hypothetical protein
MSKRLGQFTTRTSFAFLSHTATVATEAKPRVTSISGDVPGKRQPWQDNLRTLRVGLGLKRYGSGWNDP